MGKKLVQFYSAEYSRSKIFHKLIRASAASRQVVRELAETSTKDLHVLAGFAQFLFKLWRTAQLGFWPGGSVEAGETARAGNFETSNPLTKCQKSTQRGAGVSVVLPSYFGTGLHGMNVGFASGHLRSRISSS